MASRRDGTPAQGAASPGAVMRAFVCSELPAPLQAECGSAIARMIEGSGGRLRAIPPMSAHLTYTFIGALSDDRLPLVVEAVVRATADVRPLDAKFGCPQVLWHGSEARLVLLPMLNGHRWFQQLATAVTSATAEALPGVSVNGTRAPHVTLARFVRGTRGVDARRVEDVLARAYARWDAEARLDAVHLVESQLEASGPRYIVRWAGRLN